VLAGELRDGIGPARLADGAGRRDVSLANVVGLRPEDLARREVDEPLERLACRERRLENVVAMNPAPPVTKIRLPWRGTRRVYRPS
jgi:hypothetical protein